MQTGKETMDILVENTKKFKEFMMKIDQIAKESEEFGDDSEGPLKTLKDLLSKTKIKKKTFN